MTLYPIVLAGMLLAAAPAYSADSPANPSADAAADLAGARLALQGPASGWPQALSTLEEAARAGDPTAAWRAGLMVRNGKGTAPDSLAARRWLGQAAQGGVPEAMFVLANMLAEGEGSDVDMAAAHAWLERAAALGHPAAMQQLAQLAHAEGADERANALLKAAAHALQHRAGVP
jgi:TPR repeat protein